jgi:hypothetical protein
VVLRPGLVSRASGRHWAVSSGAEPAEWGMAGSGLCHDDLPIMDVAGSPAGTDYLMGAVDASQEQPSAPVAPSEPTVILGQPCDECGGAGAVPIDGRHPSRSRVCPVCSGVGETGRVLTMSEFRHEAAAPQAVREV